MADENEDVRAGQGTWFFYAYTAPGTAVPADIEYALRELAGTGGRVVVIHSEATSAAVRQRLQELSSDVVSLPGIRFETHWYRKAIESRPVLDESSGVVLTGDSWIGPSPSLPRVIRRMAGTPHDVWQMVENATNQRDHLPAASPLEPAPWVWTWIRGDKARAAVRTAFFAEGAEPDRNAEWLFGRHAALRGWRHGFAFAAADFPSPDPGLQNVPLLVQAGCPIIEKAVFQGYPPQLNRLGINGRAVVAAIEAGGFPMPFVWQSLVRYTPPKTLNTNASMLEVVHGTSNSSETSPCRIAVVARVTDLGEFDYLLEHVRHLPSPTDLFFTTTDGLLAGRLDRWLEAAWPEGMGSYEIRVTPVSPGKDMADFFVACKDVLREHRYDLVVKLDLRKHSNKTLNAARYLRSYQYDNLLKSEGHVRELLRLFDREPNLGLVFPPMIHIGFPTMGNGWMGLEEQARILCRELGIKVPLDEVSPLAPYGGMLIARPAALRSLSRRAWTYSDYRQSGRWHARLHQLQERLLTAAAAEAGYHSRTVLTPEHAAIGHTALEYKADEMFSTTRGYPVEQITLLHRLGSTGAGGSAALVRMYISANHPWLRRLVAPVARVTRLGRRIVRGVAHRGTIVRARMSVLRTKEGK